MTEAYPLLVGASTLLLMDRLLMFFLLIFGSLSAFSQESDPQYKDPQNMRVAPEHTDCHKLPKTFENLTEALPMLKATRFYYDQSLKTTRRSGLMRARFLSCDFKNGYLLIHFNGQDQVYPNVEVRLWEQFQQTADIDGFYYEYIENLPRINPQ
jgi:hypothetical protein